MAVFRNEKASADGLLADPERGAPADSVVAQLLATEHWSLLSTRTITWNEMFSRASMFFTIVSATVVALALVAQATAFGPNFPLFAIPLLTMVLLVGLGTFAQLTDAAAADLWLVAGMNRLRHAYLDLAPELAPYVLAGHHDDQVHVQETGRAGVPFRRSRLLASTPALVAAVNAVVASIAVGLLAAVAGAWTPLAAALGAATGVAAMALATLEMQRARQRFWCAYRPRFPG